MTLSHVSTLNRPVVRCLPDTSYKKQRQYDFLAVCRLEPCYDGQGQSNQAEIGQYVHRRNIVSPGSLFRTKLEFVQDNIRKTSYTIEARLVDVVPGFWHMTLKC